uniref:Polypeptide N-acetylgalactosaminyltransferase n=1 Tax=Anopheles stephensi TaxID=30069 RepID=A0A182Y834_ANOST
MRHVPYRSTTCRPEFILLSLLAIALVLIVHQYSRAVFEQNEVFQYRRNHGASLTKDLQEAPGHMGEPVLIPENQSVQLPNRVKEQIALGWQRQGYNQFVSDLISVRRELPDVRDSWCREKRHSPLDLPPVSVVIVFHDEALSVLLRTVHSVLNRTPPELIREILLIDDWSSLVELKTFLDDYFLPYSDKVRILRTTKRVGLIKGRVFGAKRASAEYLVFLDAHCWYDSGLQVYGGENMELSFKVWMCGGAIQIVPCSHVAHIQKRNHPYIGSYTKERELTMKNSLRVAEVWMDEYAEFLYRLHPDYRTLLTSQNPKTVDLNERRLLRSRLACRSFGWYLQNIFPEQDDPSRAQAMGWIRNENQSGGLCLTWPMRDRSLALLHCHGLGGQQIWFHRTAGEITREGHCLGVRDAKQLRRVECNFGAVGVAFARPRKQYETVLPRNEKLADDDDLP